MKVGIIGGGAVGLLVAAYLMKANIVPVIYTRREKQALTLNKNGIDIIKNGIKENCEVKASHFLKGLKNDEDLLLITVKQYDLEPIFDYLSRNQIKTPLLFLQNGMGHIATLSKLSSDSIFLGIVEHGVLKHSDNCITHTGEGQIKIGQYKGKPGKMANIWYALHSIGFPIKIEDEWYPILLKKLIVNAVINPLTALYRVQNGGLLKNRFYFKNMEELYNEVVAAVNASETDSLWEEVISICQNTGSNYSSMYKDIENMRQTEIESILGYILEQGEKRKVPMPLSYFLYYSIKGMENIREEEGNG